MTDNPGKHRQTKLFRIKVTSTLTSQTSPWLIINSDVIMPLKLCLHAHELNSYAYFPQILSRLFLLLGFQVVMLVKHCVVMVANASSDMLRGTSCSFDKPHPFKDMRVLHSPAGDFRFWAQFIRKPVKHRSTQTNFNPSETPPRIAKWRSGRHCLGRRSGPMLQRFGMHTPDKAGESL